MQIRQLRAAQIVVGCSKGSPQTPNGTERQSAQARKTRSARQSGIYVLTSRRSVAQRAPYLRRRSRTYSLGPIPRISKTENPQSPFRRANGPAKLFHAQLSIKMLFQHFLKTSHDRRMMSPRRRAMLRIVHRQARDQCMGQVLLKGPHALTVRDGIWADVRRRTYLCE